MPDAQLFVIRVVQFGEKEDGLLKFRDRALFDDLKKSTKEM